jgi:hypothetical protein
VVADRLRASGGVRVPDGSGLGITRGTAALEAQAVVLL